MKSIIKKVFICCIACMMLFVFGDKYQALIRYTEVEESETLDIDTSALPGVWYSGVRPYHLKIKGKVSKENFFMINLLSFECETLDLSDLEIDIIPHESFLERDNLREVRLPKKLKKIESVCFSGCYNLETVVLPESLREIGHGSFMDCPKLKMEVPSNIRCKENVFNRSPGVTIVEAELDPLCGCCSWLLDWMRLGNQCDEKKDV